MDNKSKILIVIFALLVLVSVALTYKRSFIDQNFLIIQEEEGEAEEENAEE